MANSKYTNRKFVMVQNNSPEYDTTLPEISFTMEFFSKSLFTRDEFMQFTMMQVRMRPGYRSQGGSDYAKLEAGKRFATLLKVGVIAEVLV